MDFKHKAMLSNLLTDARLQNLISQLTQLRQGGVAQGKAMHKPVLLLALMDRLEDDGKTTPVLIPIDEALYERFREIWHKLLPATQTGDFFQPVLHLPADGFWSVLDKSGQPAAKKYGTLKGAAVDALWSRFHNEHAGLLALPEVREIVRMVVLDTYFPDTKKEYYAFYGQAEFIAEKEMPIGFEEPAPKYVRQLQFVQFEGFVRHWKFRENVLNLYGHTCCISGLRVQNGLLHPLVDACHIHNHAHSGIDHFDNGLALCKNLHAAFDSGLISLTDEYRIVVSKAFRESDTIYSLYHLQGQKIRLPAHTNYCPKVEYIRFHRTRWGF